MTLMGRHEFDGAVPVSVIVPVHKQRHSLTGLVLAGKGPAGVVGPEFDGSEQGFRVRVVVRDSWPPWDGDKAETVALCLELEQDAAADG